MNLPPVGPYACATGLTCQPTPSPCPKLVPRPPTTNLENGCLYAEQNEFSFQGKGSRQNVTMQADVTSPPPTAPGVVTQYWATARAVERTPQLFSSILGNTLGVSSARATTAFG